MPLAAPDVARLFTPGSRHDCGDGRTATVFALPEAELALPTGRLVACDPVAGLADENEPFLAAAPPGRYPVVLAVAEVGNAYGPGSSDTRIAAAMLRIADRPAVRWQPALSEGQDHGRLGAGDFFGYGVDAGTGCFLDASAVGPIGELVERDADPVIDAVHDARHRPATVTDPASGHSMVAFTTGWGDGHYPTWVGYAADGRLVGFVSEFFVVRQPGRGPAGG
ncbi:DUF4241 domain-containing protein [Kitasatospora sp. CB01950]|uniref:DUF4241 domain-containing protein n=1 Tax=Kitasatospora sp. CB01950 TaxID=1703930 RepID=UPI00093F2994|nr:DUF4241 domain-containing protein [Kitasatospora sp. CB01950]OKJ09083.1 hypothetical protein AMK19_16835 [Kitasatospora sp. CB01950]